MKKVVLVIVGILVLLVAVSGCGYNGLVKLDEDVKTKWAQVETQYQRRSDLIPNLVSTVKGAAKFEQGTLTQVIEARSKASQITIDPDKLTEENMQKYQAAQGQLSQALGKLMVLTENYPELKATQQFSELSAQLEGTENRITVARKDFNESVQTYNTKVRSFPNNITAGIFGFSQKAAFKADAGAQNAPKVEF
ncbi:MULTISPECIES: LemA family protein [Pedobacter]|jgi:LemA protein|uniref:LemA family protein n=1 Tax=Pedobacter panaciterrae TaxID=363849 RepID=A0ABU8NSZ1_9SPHI|nr:MULTISPECIES: LemA family protein [Pedobacter]ETZ24271.1 LemA family protein [Pedobacter sp. V48]NQX52423.1 LemA family protein [Pedobacter panaciterrae]